RFKEDDSKMNPQITQITQTMQDSRRITRSTASQEGNSARRGMDSTRPQSPKLRRSRGGAGKGADLKVQAYATESSVFRPRVLLIFLICVICGFGRVRAAEDQPPTLPIGAPAPDFCLPGVDDKTHCLKDY